MEEELVEIDIDLSKIPVYELNEELLEEWDEKFITHGDRVGIYIGILRASMFKPFGSYEKSVFALCEIGVEFETAKEIIDGKKWIFAGDDGRTYLFEDDWETPLKNWNKLIDEINDFIDWVENFPMPSHPEYKRYVLDCKKMMLFLKEEMKYNIPLAFENYFVFHDGINNNLNTIQMNDKKLNGD